jgi:hypothetical protein
MRNEVSEIREKKNFCDSLSRAISKEMLEVHEEICRQVARSVEAHFIRPRELACQRIKEIFSWKNIIYALLWGRGKVSFLPGEEFRGSLDLQELESSIRDIVHYLRRRAGEMFKKVEMELMVEDEKRKREGKTRLGARSIECKTAPVSDLVWDNEGQEAFTFPQKDAPKAISVHLSVKDICGSAGKSISQARKDMERKVFGHILRWEWTCSTRIVDRLAKMIRETKNGLVGHWTLCLLRGSIDPDKVGDGIDFLERRIKKIDDIVDDLIEARGG